MSQSSDRTLFAVSAFSAQESLRCTDPIPGLGGIVGLLQLGSLSSRLSNFYFDSGEAAARFDRRWQRVERRMGVGSSFRGIGSVGIKFNPNMHVAA